MVDLPELKKFQGKRLELRFADGYRARVKLIDVDPDAVGNELIYDAEEVLDWGPVDPKKVNRKAVCAADASGLVAWTSLE